MKMISLAVVLGLSSVAQIAEASKLTVYMGGGAEDSFAVGAIVDRWELSRNHTLLGFDVAREEQASDGDTLSANVVIGWPLLGGSAKIDCSIHALLGYKQPRDDDDGAMGDINYGALFTFRTKRAEYGLRVAKGNSVMLTLGWRF